MAKQLSFLEQDYLEAVLEQSKDGIYITDSEANTVYLNHAYELISGLSRTEMLGKNMEALVEEGVVSASGTLSVLKTGKDITIEQSFRTGKRAVITSSPIFENESGGQRIVLVVTIVQEITKIHSLQKELQRLAGQNQAYYNELLLCKEELHRKERFIAEDPISVQLLQWAKRMCLVDAPVLLSGEPGVGKSALARFLHTHSARREFPFLYIDWSAMPKEGLSAYLFGGKDLKTKEYRIGILEGADGGTVYLSELSEIPSEVREQFQSLFRSGTCMMGDGLRHKLSLRFVAGSVYTLKELQDNRLVGNELLRHLTAYTAKLLPLRQRRDDILPLAHFFLEQHNQKTGENKQFSKSSSRRLYHQTWEGNVEQLQSTVQRAALFSAGDTIEEADFLTETELSATDGSAFVVSEECRDLKYEAARLEAFYMQRAYDTYGNTRDAAASLGIDSSTFVRKRQRYQQMGLF